MRRTFDRLQEEMKINWFDRKDHYMYNYKSLNDISYKQIVECFNLAFSDYYVPIQLSEQELQSYLESSGIDKELSYGAFIDNEMVGFIFNSCDIYNNYKVVFDIGTGVVPAHRGKQVFTNLFRFAEQELKKYDIEKYYLEVLQQNNQAISMYTKQGFTITREFSVINGSNDHKEIINKKVNDVEYNEFDWSEVRDCNRVNPSYEHSTNIVKRNPNLYRVAYSQEDDKISAFCVFSKENGAIIQLGYTNLNELKVIVKELLSRFNNITVKNIDMIDSNLLEMFYSIGFNEVAKQFEMVKNFEFN